MCSSAQVFLLFRSQYTLCTCSCTVGKKQVPFRMASGNEELMHECFPKHSRMGRMKQDKETDEEGEKRGLSMERSKAGTKEKRSPDGRKPAKAEIWRTVNNWLKPCMRAGNIVTTTTTTTIGCFQPRYYGRRWSRSLLLLFVFLPPTEKTNATSLSCNITYAAHMKCTARIGLFTVTKVERPIKICFNLGITFYIVTSTLKIYYP